MTHVDWPPDLPRDLAGFRGRYTFPPYRVVERSYTSKTSFTEVMRAGECYVLSGNIVYRASEDGATVIAVKAGEVVSFSEGEYVLTADETARVVMVWRVPGL